MTWRESTTASETLASVFRRHRELGYPELTLTGAAHMAGVSLSVYDNIEKGRRVSARSYRRAAQGMRLPGGIPRVEAILAGQSDPGPGRAVSAVWAFHPSATGDEAQAGRLAELIDRLEAVLHRVETQLPDQVAMIEAELAAQRAELTALADRLPTPTRRARTRR